MLDRLVGSGVWLDIVVFLVLILSVALIVYIHWTRKYGEPRWKAEALKRARWFSKRKWYVQDVYIADDGWVVVKVGSHGLPRFERVLSFCPYHPSHSLLRDLQKMEVIEFGFHPERFDSHLEAEIAAYLSVKQSSGF